MKLFLESPSMRDRVVAGSKIHHVADEREGVARGDRIEFFLRNRRARILKPGPIMGPDGYFGKSTVENVLPIRLELDSFQYAAPAARGANCLLTMTLAVWIAGRFISTQAIHNFTQNEGWRFIGLMKNTGGDLQRMIEHFRRRGLDVGAPFTGKLVVWKRPVAP